MAQLCTVLLTVGYKVYHYFSLVHTFDFRNSKRCEIGYRYTKTNNMLDYSHHVGIERNSLFYLQWMYINPYIVSGKPESDTKSRGKEEVLKHKSAGKKEE